MVWPRPCASSKPAATVSASGDRSWSCGPAASSTLAYALEGKVAEIVAASVVSASVLKKRLYRDPRTRERIACEKDIAFYSEQQRRVLALNGKIDPQSIDDYLRHGGYRALARVLAEDDPEAIVTTITESGLRGRGGAGFPTGPKWQFARQAPGTSKYVICNADEGDPGAFVDRSLLEGDPHVVLEGMIIAAFAIGASEGYFYVRHEYQFAVERLRQALAQALDRGMLGECVLGTRLVFHVHIAEGAGAFVCGEETALMQAIEGKRGMPRTRPPFPAVEGLFGKPTNINNVETYANVPWIINHGAAAYSATGTATSKGTKIFSLTGKVATAAWSGPHASHPAPRHLRHRWRHAARPALQGGPARGAVGRLPAREPTRRADRLESLAAAGSMMGSGGMVVIDDSTCMVDLARFFLRFTCEESCGRCVPCRLGTGHLVGILDAICAGRGEIADLERLERLARVIKRSALCGLGQTAPNPVLSSLRYFGDEFVEHIVERHCRAAVCP